MVVNRKPRTYVIIAAWFSLDNVEDIAIANMVTAKHVKSIWREAKKTGIIPLESKRPMRRLESKWSKVPQPGDNCDGRPSVEENDPLLERLILYHGGDNIDRDVKTTHT